MTQWTNDPGSAPPTYDDPDAPGAFGSPTRVLAPTEAPQRHGGAGRGAHAVERSGQRCPSTPLPGPPAAPTPAFPVAGLPFSPPAGPPGSPPPGAVGPFESPPPPAYPPLRHFPAGAGPVPPGPGTGDRGRTRMLVAALVVAALVLGVAGFAIGRNLAADDEPSGAAATGTDRTVAQLDDTADAAATPTPTTPGQDGPRTEAPTLDPNLAEEPAAAVHKAVSPAVVQIETSFGLGTGFIYDGQGYILTAAHVVSNSDAFGRSTGGFEREVTVRLADGSSVAGEVLGADLNNDVAVVKIDPVPDMPVATLALGEDVEVGAIAVAIGSPFGLDQTVTQGIVSAVNRPVESPNGNVVSMVQTDAAINSGNSGGPLVNREGKVIGINTQIRTDSGDNAGIGFAVPIDLAYDVAQRLVAGEPIRLGYLGIRGGEPGFGTAGALVVRVEQASPAAAAGIAEGDVVTEANGNAIRSFEELASIIRATEPGTALQLTVERDGTTQPITVTVGEAATN
ncbi:MAG: trypsin-like peptidase domain-containing protein [Acidimicrobiales bacterium]